MTSIQPLALAYAVERTLYESSSTWEGIDAHELPLSVGEVVLRTQTGFAADMPLRFVGKTINSPLLTHKIARSLSLIRIFVLLLLTHIFARI